jgi:hypothetical protein
MMVQERDRPSTLPSPPRPPNPVNVVLDVVWRIEIEDDRDVLDVESALSNVGSAEDRVGAAAELVESEVALSLIFVAMERESREAVYAGR